MKNIIEKISVITMVCAVLVFIVAISMLMMHTYKPALDQCILKNKKLERVICEIDSEVKYCKVYFDHEKLWNEIDMEVENEKK